MFMMKHFLLLIFITISKTHVVEKFATTNRLFGSTINFPIEHSSTEDPANNPVKQENSSLIVSQNETEDSDKQEQLHDNNNPEILSQQSNGTAEEFHSSPEYEANWKYINHETVRVIFSVFSISKLTKEKKYSDRNDSQIKRYSTMFSVPSCSIQTIYSLKYFLFTVRQHETNVVKVLSLEPLVLKTSPSQDREFLSNSLLMLQLNPKEKYSVCIYYYTSNITIQSPDIFICQDILNYHAKHSGHGEIFVLTQYSIILGFLVILQTLFTIRKRRIAHIVHRHLMNKAQRLRSTLSSVSLVRQSSNNADTTAEQKIMKLNGQVNPEKNILKKRIISSPAIVLTEPIIPLNKNPTNTDENEPFLKMGNGKNHVHFLLGLDEESEGEDDNETNNDNDNDNDNNNNTTNNIPINPPLISRLSEPYGDRSDALLSMAHILDINRPWTKQS